MNAGARGHAIFMNGIQSSGKTSIAASIERRTSTFRGLTGDDVIRKVPEKQRLAQANRLFAVILDTIDQRLTSTNVIVDGAWTQRQVLQAQERYGDRGLYVILRIDESERSRRESKRRDRRLGYWDPAWHEMPGPDEIYDLVIDSKAIDIDKCAKAVLTRARQHWDDLLL